MLTFVEEHPLARRLIGFVLLVGGLACTVFIVCSLVRDGSLWLFGKKTSAVVLESWAEQTSAEGAAEVTFDYFIRYQFETETGRIVTASTRVGAGEWVGVGYGQQGSVRHDAMDDQSQPAAAPIFQDQKHITEHTSGGMQAGQGVYVVYFAPYPEHNRLDESRFVTLLACAYLPFVMVGAILIVVGLRLVRSSIPPAAEQL
jgi:hypothetical protein